MGTRAAEGAHHKRIGGGGWKVSTADPTRARDRALLLTQSGRSQYHSRWAPGHVPRAQTPR